MTQSTTTIIIPAHNEGRYLPHLFDSIRRYGPDSPEIILVDNGSEDDSADLGHQFGATVVRTSQALKPAVARNLGVVHSSTDGVLVFLDADVILTSDWREEWCRQLAVLERQPLQVTGGVCDISMSPGWIERAWFSSFRSGHRTYVNGANLITTRELFNKIGGFDESLETGEDVAFCEKARAGGCDIVVNNRFRVTHEGYPKSSLAFVRRERWHGRGDFSRLTRIVKSKVAVATIAFIAFHVAALWGVVAALFLGGTLRLFEASCVAVVLFCLLRAIRMRPWGGARGLLAKCLLVYLYFIGRSLSFWDALPALLGASSMPVKGVRTHR